MNVYPPLYIEHYADRFIELCLQRYGLTLEQYLYAPGLIELYYIESEPRPLLAAQRAVQKRLDAEEATAMQRQAAAQRYADYRVEEELKNLPRRNGQVIEPLHHTRHPKRSLKGDFTRRPRHAG